MAKFAVYQVWVYDVWGNAKDGFDVNDRSKSHVACVRVGRSGAVSGRALAMAIASGCEIDGHDDVVLYFTRKDNGRPVCEAEFLGFVEAREKPHYWDGREAMQAIESQA